MHSPARERQEHLIRTNVCWLRQVAALLDRISDTAYTASPGNLAPHRAGSHLRHILEFYECFLAGLPGSRIDYDARRRDLSLESTRKAAQERIRSIMDRLECEPSLRTDSVVWVRIEDSSEAGIREPFIISSIGRELQALSSHTIHHFALIAIVLRSLGIPVDPELGMAPSTLRYMAAQGAAEAA
jgi:uncharacterized damage-inducible protein DinB